MTAQDLLNAINASFSTLSKSSLSTTVEGITVERIGAWTSWGDASLKISAETPEGQIQIQALIELLSKEPYGLKESAIFKSNDYTYNVSEKSSTFSSPGSTLSITPSGLKKISNALMKLFIDDKKTIESSSGAAAEGTERSSYAHLIDIGVAKRSTTTSKLEDTSLEEDDEKIDELDDSALIDESVRDSKILTEDAVMFFPQSVPVPLSLKDVENYVNKSSERCFRWTAAGKALNDQTLLNSGIGLAYTQSARRYKLEPLVESSFDSDEGLAAGLTAGTLLTLNYNLALETAEYIIMKHGRSDERARARVVSSQLYKYEAHEIEEFRQITSLADNILDRLGKEKGFKTEIGSSHLSLSKAEVSSGVDSLEHVNIVLKSQQDKDQTFTSSRVAP